MEAQSASVINNNSNHVDSHTQPTHNVTNLTITAQPFIPASNNSNNATASAQSFAPVPTAGCLPIHSRGVGTPGHPIYSPVMHSSAIHQSGQMYAAMLPAQIPNVYVNNVTANVNLHGWTHPVSAYIPGGTPHYVLGDQVDQNPPVVQAMSAMPVTIAPPNANITASGNGNPQIGSLSNRCTRRGRGRGGSGSSRRGDYNSQRHPALEGSPIPQQQLGKVQERIGVQQPLTTQQKPQSQKIENLSQLLNSGPPTYASQSQYPHPPAYTSYPYQTYFATQNAMLHTTQVSQQATGTPLYVSHIPLYNTHHVYNYMTSPFVYPPVLNPPEYQYLPGEDVECDESHNLDGMVAPMWNEQTIYADEYGMEMRGVSCDEVNHNTSSVGNSDTPCMLSPNYAIYNPQFHNLQQHMSMMHIYDESQITQMQDLQTSVSTELEQGVNECGSQHDTIQIVNGTIFSENPLQMSNETQIIQHEHAQQSQNVHSAQLEIKTQNDLKPCGGKR